MRTKAAERMCVALAALALAVAPGCTTAKTDRAQMQRERTEAQRTEALAGMDILTAESFDTTLTWRLDTDQSDPAEVVQTDPRPGTTDRAMAVRFKLGPQKKIVVGRRFTLPGDFSKHQALVIDVASLLPSECSLSLGILTQPGWTYFESPAQRIWPGKNLNVAFRLDRADFKCAESSWKYTRRVANPSAVVKLILIIQPAEGGEVAFDNLRLAAPKASK